MCNGEKLQKCVGVFEIPKTEKKCLISSRNGIKFVELFSLLQLNAIFNNWAAPKKTLH